MTNTLESFESGAGLGLGWVGAWASAVAFVMFQFKVAAHGAGVGVGLFVRNPGDVDTPGLCPTIVVPQVVSSSRPRNTADDRLLGMHRFSCPGRRQILSSVLDQSGWTLGRGWPGSESFSTTVDGATLLCMLRSGDGDGHCVVPQYRASPSTKRPPCRPRIKSPTIRELEPSRMLSSFTWQSWEEWVSPTNIM